LRFLNTIKENDEGNILRIKFNHQIISA